MYKYYGNKGKRFYAEIRATMPSYYSRSVEFCAGLASMTRTLIPPDRHRTIIEKDPGMVALLKVTRDRPVEFAGAMNMIPYNRESFELAADIRDNEYDGCKDDIVAACTKKILTDLSYNAACKSYRDIDKPETMINEKDPLRCHIKALQYRERYYRQIIPDVLRMSDELQGVEIIHDDFMNHLSKLNDERLFAVIDPPYRPAVRQTKTGYDYDMTDEEHMRFLKKLQEISKSGLLTSKVMIFSFVQEECLSQDLYCQYLLPIGFRLIFLKEIYLPKVVREGMVKKKTKRSECIFINYDDCLESSYVTADRVFDYAKVFGKGRL